MQSRDKVETINVKFDKSFEQGLAKRQFKSGKKIRRLDQVDRELVALANGSSDKIIVSEEGGVVAAKEYLLSAFGIRVLSSQEALDFILSSFDQDESTPDSGMR